MITVKVSRIRPDAILPWKATSESAGYDLYSCLQEDLIIPPSCTVLIPTGIVMEIPAGYEGQIRPRSGMVLKQNFFIPNSPGTIDADYRGEIQIIGSNWGTEDILIAHGQRVAQIVFHQVPHICLQETDSLSDTKRGDGGFGHSGS